MIDLYKTMAKYIAKRICFECDHRYTGHLHCPACGQPSGEPVPTKEDESAHL